MNIGLHFIERNFGKKEDILKGQPLYRRDWLSERILSGISWDRFIIDVQKCTLLEISCNIFHYSKGLEEYGRHREGSLSGPSLGVEHLSEIRQMLIN
jgi:hypothetical protein